MCIVLYIYTPTYINDNLCCMWVFGFHHCPSHLPVLLTTTDGPRAPGQVCLTLKLVVTPLYLPDCCSLNPFVIITYYIFLIFERFLNKYTTYRFFSHFMNFIDKNPHKMSILNGNYHEKFWDVLDSKFGSLLCHLFFLWPWAYPLISELFNYLFNEDNHFNMQLLRDYFISNLLISETLLWVLLLLLLLLFFIQSTNLPLEHLKHWH